MLFGEAQIVEIGKVARQAIGAHRQHAFIAFAAHFGLAVGFHFLRVGIAVAIVGLVARHLGTCVDLAFTGTAVFASLLFLAFFGPALVLPADVLGAFPQRLVAVVEVEGGDRELCGLGEGGLVVQHPRNARAAAPR